MFHKKLVVKKGDFVLFKTDGAWDYEIHVSDLMDAYFVGDWTKHMAEKTWVTKEHLYQFGDLVSAINRVKK